MMRKCVNISQLNSAPSKKWLLHFCYFLSHLFKLRYKLNVFENKKATMKLLTECVKLKKLMAANTNKLPINIEF